MDEDGIIGASLSEPHTSVTALRMRVCIYACLDRPLTVNFKSAHSNISWWLTSAKPWKRAWRATARLQGRRETDWERRLFKLNALAIRTATHFLNHGTSLTIARQGRLRVTVGQQGVRWLQVSSWHDRSYIAWIPLLPHDLTVKLSPCPCSRSSLAGRMAACLWAFQMKFVTRSGSPQDDSPSY